MNQMNMHGNMPANSAGGGAPSMAGMHIPPGGSMPQQSTSMMPQQPVGMMPQQPGTMIPQQQGAMMQQQTPAMMQQQSPQQMQPGQPGQGPGTNTPQQPPQEKMDNISKVKTLIVSLRDSISLTLKAAAQNLHQHHANDSNCQKPLPSETNGTSPPPSFDTNLEEFYAMCDQMELHLRTAVTCIQQAQSAGHYLPLTVIPSRLDVNSQETTLSYPAFLSTVRLQISYAKDIHDTLVAAAQNIAPAE